MSSGAARGGGSGGSRRAGGGMACSQCRHPTCSLSSIRRALCACSECDSGVLVLEPSFCSGHFKLICNNCGLVLSFSRDAKKVEFCSGDMRGVTCEECEAPLLQLEFLHGKAPQGTEGNTVVGTEARCIFCEPPLKSIIEMIRPSGSGPPSAGVFGGGSAGGGRGRGRGRARGRGRGRGRARARARGR